MGNCILTRSNNAIDFLPGQYWDFNYIQSENNISEFTVTGSAAGSLVEAVVFCEYTSDKKVGMISGNIACKGAGQGNVSQVIFPAKFNVAAPSANKQLISCSTTMGYAAAQVLHYPYLRINTSGQIILRFSGTTNTNDISFTPTPVRWTDLPNDNHSV